MKKLFFTFCFLSLVFVSCENELVDKADAGGFSVSEAKNFYNKNAQRVYDDKGKTIDWENGIFHEFNGEKILEFPLNEKNSDIIIQVTPRTTRQDAETILENVFTRVVFVKKGTSIILRELHYVPNLRYLESKNYEISSDFFGNPTGEFKGMIITEDLNDKFLSLTKIKDSKVVGVWKTGLKNVVDKNNKMLTFSKDEEEGEPGMMYHGNETVHISNPRNSPPPDWSGFFSFPRDNWSGSGWSSSDSSGGTPWGSNPDNDGSGGSTGNGPTSDPVINNAQEIINTDNLPACAKEIVDKLKDTNQNDLKKIINLLGGTNLPTIIMNDVSHSSLQNPLNPNSTTYAISTRAFSNGLPIPNTYTLNISSQYLSTATDLSIASTIIHEFIHCYFMTLFDNPNISPPVNTGFGDLFQDYLDLRPIQEHDNIADNFLNIIASSLQEFNTGSVLGTGQNPLQVYQDLAYMGLQGTSNFTNTTNLNYLTPFQQNTIAATIQAEATNHTQTYNGVTRSPIGQPCN